MGTPTPPSDDENDAVAFAESVKLRLMATSVPNTGAGADGCMPPNDCEPSEVAPVELRTTFIGAVKSWPAVDDSVVAAHIAGWPTTERK